MPVARRLTFPFVPKSRTWLQPGHFWGVPLSDGRFACGRVLQTTGEELPNTRTFLGGLHDWVGEHPPTSDAIGHRALLEVGVMHIKAITETGGEVLGVRPLDADELVPPLLLSAHGGQDARVLRGAQWLRLARRDEWGKYPILGVWGYSVIRQLAERRFVRGAGDAA
jgi:hypothetical protein